MSLLGSIFGSTATTSSKDDGGGKSNSNKKKEGITSIFQKSSKLPDRPNHEPVVSKKRGAEKKKKISNEQEEEESYNPKKKKRRKSKKENNDDSTKDDNGDDKKAKKKIDDDDDDDKNDDTGKDDDADDTEERTVFVGNLPISRITTRKSLTGLFKDCGPIESTRLRSIPVKGTKLPQNRKGDQNLMRKVSANTNQIDDTLKNTVQGYVVFKNTVSVDEALKKNNKLKIDGYRIRVDRANPTVDSARSVFVGNLPYGAEEDSLSRHFVKGCDLQIGDVEGVRIIRDKETWQCKGFGYVLFKDRSMVPTALKLHDTTYLKRSIRVNVCGKRFKSNNKSNQNKPAYEASPNNNNNEKTTVGALRRVLAKQTKEAAAAASGNKRKRGDKKKSATSIGASKKQKKSSSSGGGLSKRAALDKKVDQRVRKLQKRISKGMGKARRK